MPNRRKIVIASILFFVLWAAWCFFVVLKLGPEVASHQLYNHVFAISLVLCLVPPGAYAVILLKWLAGNDRR